MKFSAKISVLRIINPRMLVFASVVLFLIGVPIYYFTDTTVRQHFPENKYKKIDLKWLGSFEMDQISATNADIPEEYRNLDGHPVMLEGEIWVGRGATASKFDLLYSISTIGRVVPKVQHFVKASMVGGKKATYFPGLVDAKGTLHVGIVKDKDAVASVYRLDVESIDPVKQPPDKTRGK